MGVPLHHDVGVVGEPDGAKFWHGTLAVLHQLFLPTFVNRTTGFAQFVGNAHGLNGVFFFEFPIQIVACHEVAKAWVERLNVIVLKVNLNEGFPVVVAFVQLHMV